MKWYRAKDFKIFICQQSEETQYLSSFFEINLIFLMRGGFFLEHIDENQININTKELPKEYLILKLRMSFNDELYDKKLISFEIYNKMQKLLIKKMDKIILEFKT